MTSTDSPPHTDRDPGTDTNESSGVRLWAAGSAIAAVVVALAVGTLLNAQDLLATAERQPFGWQRDVAVAFAQPVADLSAAVGLDEPRSAIDTALGRADEGRDGADEPASGEVVAPAAETGEETTSDGTASRGPEDGQPVVAGAAADVPSGPSGDAGGSAEVDGDGDGRSNEGRDPNTAPSVSEPAVATLNGVERGPVTAADPLRLYIGGDSMVEIQFGIALEDLADDTGKIEVLAIDYDRGSGLSRPDYVDWPARLKKVSADLDPDAMVLYFGGNDAQPLKIDGVVYEPEAPEWQAEYQSRVAAVMDQLTEAGHYLYWMGLPIPQSDTMVRRFGILNRIYEEEAGKREMVTFVSMWEVFADSSGVYAEFLPNQNGDVVDMRLNDGIHLTTAGAYRAARPTIARIIEEFEIE